MTLVAFTSSQSSDLNTLDQPNWKFNICWSSSSQKRKPGHDSQLSLLPNCRRLQYLQYMLPRRFSYLAFNYWLIASRLSSSTKFIKVLLAKAIQFKNPQFHSIYIYIYTFGLLVYFPPQNISSQKKDLNNYTSMLCQTIYFPLPADNFHFIIWLAHELALKFQLDVHSVCPLPLSRITGQLLGKQVLR